MSSRVGTYYLRGLSAFCKWCSLWNYRECHPCSVGVIIDLVGALDLALWIEIALREKFQKGVNSPIRKMNAVRVGPSCSIYLTSAGSKSKRRAFIRDDTR